MTIKYRRIISCPGCGAKNPVTLWSTINVQVNPEAREMLLDGKVNIFECIGCGKEVFVANQLLYHDMDNRFCVYCFPFHKIKDERFLDEFSENGEVTLEQTGISPEEAGYFNNIHYVFSMDEMVRYIKFREILSLKKSQRQSAS